jgi:hypothetical protein
LNAQNRLFSLIISILVSRAFLPFSKHLSCSLRADHVKTTAIHATGCICEWKPPASARRQRRPSLLPVRSATVLALCVAPRCLPTSRRPCHAHSRSAGHRNRSTPSQQLLAGDPRRRRHYSPPLLASAADYRLSHDRYNILIILISPLY